MERLPTPQKAQNPVDMSGKKRGGNTNKIAWPDMDAFGPDRG